MKRCAKCDMDVRGGDRLCPLCQSRLTGEVDPAVFPALPTVFRQFRLFFRLLVFLTASAGVVCAALNLMLPSTGHWALYVLLGIGCFWVSLMVALRKRRNIFKNITDQVVILSLLAVLWDLLIGWTGWSIDFFIPIACGVGLLSLAVLARVKRMPAGEYVMYLIADILFGLVPTVFYLIGWSSVAIPILICMSLSLITLVALVVTEGKNILREISRRFHF